MSEQSSAPEHDSTSDLNPDGVGGTVGEESTFEPEEDEQSKKD